MARNNFILAIYDRDILRGQREGGVSMIKLGLYLIWSSSFIIGLKGYTPKTKEFWIYITFATFMLLTLYE